MHVIGFPLAQDTAVVALAADTLTLAPGWIGAVIAAVAAALLIVLILVLLELRRVGNTWSRFLATTEERTRPLVEHANAAARNVEHITRLARNDLGRVSEAFTGLADGIGDVSGELQTRLKDLSALLDLAQSEAENAVLDAASKVRAFRSGIGLLRWPPGGRPRTQGSDDDQSGDDQSDDARGARTDGTGEDPPGEERSKTKRPEETAAADQK